MKMHSFRSLALGAVLLGAAGIASAGIVNFSSQGLTPNTALATPTEISGVNVFAAVPASGWQPSQCSNPLTYTGSDPCLYYKFTSGTPSETGLGLTGDPAGNNEIYWPNGIAFVPLSGSISGFELGSVQNGESWQVLGCSLEGPCTNVIDAGIGNGSSSTLSITGLGNYQLYIVNVPCADSSTTCDPWVLGGGGGTGRTDQANNILIMSMTTVPEPGTLALLAAGLAALGFAVTCRRKAKTDA